MNNNYRHIQQHNQSPHHHHHHQPNPYYGNAPIAGNAAFHNHNPLPLAHHPQYTIPRSVSSAPVSPAPYVIYRNTAQLPPPPVPQASFSPLTSPVASQVPASFPSPRQSVYSQSYFDEKRASVAAAAQGMVQQYSQPSTPAAAAKAPDRYHRRKSLSTSLVATEPAPASTSEEPSSSSSTTSNSNSNSASNLSSASSVSSASPSPALTNSSTSTGNTSTNTNIITKPASKQSSTKLPPIQTQFNSPAASAITQSPKQQPQQHRHSKSSTTLPHSHSSSSISKQPTNRRKSLIIESSSNPKREKPARDKEFLEITNDRKLHARQQHKQLQQQSQQRKPPSTLVLPSDKRRNSTIGLTNGSSRSVSSPVSTPYGSSTSLSNYGHAHSRSKDLPSYGSTYQSPSSKDSHRRAMSSATITQSKAPSNPARPISPMSMQAQPSPVFQASEIKRPSSSMSSSYARKPQPVQQQPAVDRRAEFSSRSTTPSVSKPSSMADLRQPGRQQSRSKFSKLKKAFSFGSKKESLQQKSSISSDDRSSIFSMPSYRRKPSITSTKSAILPRTATDNTSIASNKSTASNISFANLKRMSRGLFKHKHDESVDSAISLSQQQPAPVFNTTNLPFVGHHSKSTSIASSATATQPVLSHSVAEAEPPTTLNMESPINSLSVMAQPASPREVSPLEVPREEDRLPSLTSTDSSAPNTEEPIEHGDECDEDDMAVGDTVFPKKLDLLTVETIRSSLERTKSLERRRSRRSTRSAKSEKSEATAKDQEEEVPNPTEVHVHEEAISDVPSKDTPAPRSILKGNIVGGSNHSASSSITTISTINNNNLVSGNNDNNNNSASSTNSTAIGGGVSATGVDSAASSGLIDFDLEHSELNLDFSFENMSMPRSIESDDVVDAVQKNKENNYQPSQIAQKRLSMHSKTPSSASRSPSPTVSTDGNSYHYHPLYRNRFSQFVPSHSNHSSSETSMLSQHGHHHSSSSLSGTVSSPISRPGRTVAFSSRIVIYDTYDKNDYDRRAELDTCNRLTPALAQQIKEELNNFKMEMEIHADSRIYTHFF